MRHLLASVLLAALIVPTPSCGSGGGGGAALGPPVNVLVKVADVTTPHGSFIVRDVNNPASGQAAEDCRAIGLTLHQGEVVPITAVPAATYHVVWHGTNNDTSTANSNAFTAVDHATVIVEFLP